MEQITVIIPAYNCADYLDYALISLQQQTYTKWEAILIDDASSDGKTPQLCDIWGNKEKRIKVIHFEKNQGVSAVRNEGLRLTSSPLITFLDSDDFLAPNHLETLYQTLIQEKASISMCGIRRCGKNGKLRQRMTMATNGKVYLQPNILALTILDHTLTSHLCNKLFRKELFEGVLFPVGRTFEDYTISPEIMMKAKKVVHTGLATYNYRKNPKSITQEMSLKRREDFIIASLERIEQIKKFPYLNEEEKSALLVFPMRRIFGQYRHIYDTSPTKERKIILENITSRLLSHNFSINRRFILLQILLQVLEMHSVSKKYTKL